MNNKSVLISATMHYETIMQEPYKPVHVPTYEDTAENIDYCSKCPHDDCIYETLEICQECKCASKRKYVKTEKWKQHNVSRQEKLSGALMPIAHAKQKVLS